MTDIATRVESETPANAAPFNDASAAAARAKRLRLQAGAGAFAVLTLIAGAVQFTAVPQPGAGNPPVILASPSPVKIQQIAESVRDQEPPSKVAVAEPVLAEAPAIRVGERTAKARDATVDKSTDKSQGAGFSSVLTTKLVKTIVIRPYSESDEAESAKELDARGPYLRQALATTTPGAVSAPTPSSAVEMPRVISSSTPANPIEVQRVSTAPAPAPVVAGLQVDMIVTGSIPEKAIAPRTTPVAAGYFVQLAAADSESEAQQKARMFQSRLANALGARELAIYQGSVKDRTVYRVRVAAASRDEANQLCSKLKSANAACFVARE